MRGLRLARQDALEKIFARYAAQAAWMREVGIYQWNDTDYLGCIRRTTMRICSGAGKAILREAEKLAKVRGMEAIRLDCAEGNARLNAVVRGAGQFSPRYLHKTARTTEFSARSCSEEGPAVFWAERKPDATRLACYLFVHCGN